MSNTTFSANYATFIHKKYLSLPEQMRNRYGNATRYALHYPEINGFEEWLESLRGKQLDEWKTVDVATAFARHAKRVPNEIPAILRSISREYHIGLPVIEGILTPAYWEDIAEKEHWEAFNPLLRTA